MKTNNSTAGTQHRPTATELLHILKASFLAHRYRLLLGFLALLGVDFLQLIIPRIIKRGVDGLATESISQAGLWQLSLVIVFFALIVVGLRFLWRYLIIGFSRFLERDIRVRLFHHVLKLDAPFFEQHTTGDLMARSSNDLSAIQMACGMGMVAAVDALVISVAAVGFMIHINAQLTLLALLPMPFLAICTRILSGKLHRRFTTVQERFAQLTEFSRSTFISIRLIKSYTMEDFQAARFGRLGSKYVKSNLRVASIQGLMFPIATLVGNLGMLLVLFFGGKLVIDNSITMGDFVAFITYLYMLVWPMMAIGWVANLVQRGLTSLGRIHQVLEAEPMLPQIKDDSLAPVATPSLLVRSLNFSYPFSTEKTLSNISLEFATGIHGITGRTGSGKSTLCKLLCRIYPVENTLLFFEGRDVNQLPVEYIRSHISYVGQEPILFSETIANNIGLGKPDATSLDIIEAARSAAIHDDIMEFPEGYETVIGERGVKLSGGQRQRLALARALLYDKPILIIDDGLSAVDVTTEHEIFANLKDLLQGKTVIIVSNRIKLLSMTDRIIVFEEGRVEVDGNHDLLLQKSGLYRSMYSKQMRQGFDEELIS